MKFRYFPLGTILLKLSTVLILCLVSVSAFAQAHKGMSFQGVIKLPNGVYPSKAGVKVTGTILSPNNCILMEEEFLSVNIVDGYLNLVIGNGQRTVNDKGFSLRDVMDNSKVISDLTCLYQDGSVNYTTTAFNPIPTNGARKFRLNLEIESTPILVDFNLRAVAYAVNAETLDGKLKTDFIQTTTSLTQNRLESFMNSLISSPAGSSVKWDGSGFVSYDPDNGANFTSIPNTSITSLSYTKLTGIPTNLTQIAGLTCIDGQILKKISGVWGCANESGGSSFTGLTGDVSTTGTGTMTATVESVGGSSAANINSAELAANAATRLNVANSIVKRDSAGDFTAGTITANLMGAASLNVLKAGGTMTGNLTFDASRGVVFKDGTGTNSVALQGPTGAIGTNFTLRLPSSSAAIDGQVLTSDTAGNLTWTTPTTTATSYSGVLPIANGGTNSSTALVNNRMMISNGGAIVVAPALTNGQIFIGSTGAAPQAATLTAGTGISIANSAGGISISASLSSSMLSDGTDLLKATQMPANCSAGQTLTFSSPTGTWTCTAISISGANFGNQSANVIYAGPSSGGAAAPTFRSLTSTDLPAGTASVSGGTTDRVSYFTGATTLGSSPIYVNSGNIGIGATPSGAKLHVAGSLKVVDGTEAVGKVLTSSADGTASWQTPADASLRVLKSGDSMSGNLTFDASRGVVFKDGTGTNSVALQGPTGAIGTNYTLRLPSSSAAIDGQVLTSDTAGNLTWTTPTTTATSYSGVLPIANGGTNSSTALVNNRMMISNGSAIVEAPALTNGQIFIGSTGAAPQAATLTAGTGISIANSAGGISISASLSSSMLSDGTDLLKATQMPANCSAGQTLTFSSPTGTWTCTAISVTGANFGNQSANVIYAGPSSGGAAAPTFRSLASSDLPAGTVSASGGVTDRVPYFSSATALGSSPIYVNGVNVGIGTSPSGAKLHVSGSLKVVDGTQAAGKVLTSSADGTASWQTPTNSVPTYTMLTRSSDFTPGTTTNYSYYLISGFTTVTMPSPATAGSGFVIGLKRVGASNINIAASSGTIDGSASYSLSYNYTHVTLISDGANWFIIDGGGVPTGGGCVQGSQIYAAGSIYSLSVSAAQAANCTYSITLAGAGGGAGSTGDNSTGAGGGLTFTFKPSGSGTFDILAGARGLSRGEGGQGGFGGGGTGASAGGGGGASAVAYNAVVLGIAGGGGGATSSTNHGGAGGSGGAAGATSPNSSPGLGGGSNVGGGLGQAVGGSSSGAGGGTGGGLAYPAFSVSGGGAGTSSGGGGGGGYGGGSSGNGGGGGGGYINSGAVQSFNASPGAAGGANGYVKIEWN